MNADLTTRMNGREHRPGITMGAEADVERRAAEAQPCQAQKAWRRRPALRNQIPSAIFGIMVIGSFLHKYLGPIIVSAASFALGALHII
jgi:hypothetical protein